VESSKTRGMGHLFRSLLYASYLDSINEQYIVLINNDKSAIDILASKNISYRLVDFSDTSNWQTQLIKEYHADVWLEDKFETSIEMAMNIKKNHIPLCAIDEFGPGADLCDVHFAGMIYLTGHEVRGKKICCGAEYVILNPEIDQYKKIRSEVSNVIISLGGSDPYGLTVDIVKEISKADYNVEIIIGPDFEYRKELEEANVKRYPILQNVPSLIQEFSKFDFAITGGGVTCCEANSCGIPCIIFANAPHEVHTGYFMEERGGAVYAGSYEGWDKAKITHIADLDVKSMSQAGMQTFDTKAIERIFFTIRQEMQK
jgi:spore coat polysaccharide biosynthesis predicted glycosyltransferase SpsG